eukprot:1157315-Pelagomonas_calceolata.AAC.7
MRCTYLEANRRAARDAEHQGPQGAPFLHALLQVVKQRLHAFLHMTHICQALHIWGSSRWCKDSLQYKAQHRAADRLVNTSSTACGPPHFGQCSPHFGQVLLGWTA